MVSLNQSSIDSIWLMVNSGHPIDSEMLYKHLSATTAVPDDFRSKILIRDSLNALSAIWGKNQLRNRLTHDRALEILDLMDFCKSDEGFVTLKERLMTPIDTKNVLQMLRELGERIGESTTITVGGSLALMLYQLISRHTDDIDLVDPIPPVIQENHSLLNELSQRYGLRLAHFQSHYLPDQWVSRTSSLGVFGKLNVRLIDSLDILTGKLFSKRTKDLDDLRQAINTINLTDLKERLQRSTSSFRSDDALLQAATSNWYILTGETSLP